MKFMVKVGYNKYIFDDSKEAFDFAMTAKTHNIEKDKDDRRVRVELLNDGEEEE